MNKLILNRKKLTIIVFIIISILLLMLGFYHIYQRNKYVKGGDKVNAVVENILIHPEQGEEQSQEDYEEDLLYYNELLEKYRNLGIIGETTTVAIIINYEYKNQEYTYELGYYSSDIRINQKVVIYVNKNNPKDFIYEGQNQFGLYFCMIVGSVMLLVSLGIYFINRYNNKCNLLLTKNGKKIQAEILYADEEENKTSFNKHPFVFTCVYKDIVTNEEFIFTSDSVYCKNQGSTYIGSKIDVYIDPNNYNNYYVDVKNFEK